MLSLSIAKKFTTTHINSTDNPDFFMTEAVYTKFNSAGQIRNQFQTDKITHFTASNSYVFEHPNIVMHNSNEQPWLITANKGKSEQGKSKIYLWDNVKVTQAAGTANSECDITTSELSIFPDVKFAETTQPVTIIQNSNITKAVGMQADFKAGIIKLLSNVKSVYQNQSK